MPMLGNAGFTVCLLTSILTLFVTFDTQIVHHVHLLCTFVTAFFVSRLAVLSEFSQYYVSSRLSQTLLTSHHISNFSDNARDNDIDVCSYITTKLPTTARENGVRIRWWQPHHSGQASADWIIDEIVIGGKEVNPNEVNDDFGGGRQTVNWLQMANIRYDEYCGIPYAAVGQAAPGESVVLTTSDVTVASGDIIEFSIAIGCGLNDSVEFVNPVYLHYSVDYGVSWYLVTTECLPFEPGCNGKAQTASIYYQTGRWRRITIPLPSSTVSL